MCTILLSRSTNTATPVLCWGSGGSPKKKSRLIDFQQSLGIGSGFNGALPDGELFTRWHCSQDRM